MKLFLLISWFLVCSVQMSAQQQATSWSKWSWLIGEWSGEGNGKPGQGSGTFAFKESLNGKILVRNAHSEYPATDKKPAITHDDLMIVYPSSDSIRAHANYYDNEGHVINYAVSVNDSSIIFLSEKVTGQPTFRLTYVLLDSSTVNVVFELSQDGEHFMKYVEGKCKRK